MKPKTEEIEPTIKDYLKEMCQLVIDCNIHTNRLGEHYCIGCNPRSKTHINSDCPVLKAEKIGEKYSLNLIRLEDYNNE